MDFIDKKELFADALEKFKEEMISKEELHAEIIQYENDEDFRGKELFENIFNELKTSLDELSKKELKQRILLIRSYLE